MKTYLILDGANIFIRSYCAIPALDLRGNCFGGTKGFLFSLKKYIELCKPDEVFIAWDGARGSFKRKSLIESYKSGRKPPKLNRNYDFEVLGEQDEKKNKEYQKAKLNDYLGDLPVHQITVEDIEADDIIAYLKNYFSEDRKVIVSGDRDFYQLLDDKTIIYLPIKKVFINRKRCFQEYCIYPVNFALAKAVIGDKSDCIQGVRGIGFKNLLKYFPFFSQEEKIELNQLFSFCEEKGTKYERFLNSRDIIIRNLEAVQLENPTISMNSIVSIKKQLQNDLAMNLTSFRVKLLNDGINNIDDNFLKVFKTLFYKNRENKQ